MELHEWVGALGKVGFDSGRRARSDEGRICRGVRDGRVVVSLWRKVVPDSIVDLALGVDVVLKGAILLVE
jgi:hypothetical protein